MDLEEKTHPLNIEVIYQGLEIDIFGHMIALWAQSHYVTGIPKDLHIIYLQLILKSEGKNRKFVSQRHGDNDSYEEINFK